MNISLYLLLYVFLYVSNHDLILFLSFSSLSLNLFLQSDLRVRHREETKVVSRLTMENMNLASRCREAIAQVAALKKEILVYQKRQSEWQKEIMQLRQALQQRQNGTSNKER